MWSFDRRLREDIERLVGEVGDDGRNLPSALAVLVGRVLDVDGVGISVVTEQVRVPVGASGPAAAIAESLEFTAGDGPCLEASRHGVMIDAPGALLAQRWAALSNLWFQHTPYRSAASWPLKMSGDLDGALNLFFAHDRGGQGLNPVEAGVVATQASSLMQQWVEESDRVNEILSSPLATVRAQVWVAMAMVMEEGSLSGPDALDLLRAFAFGHDSTVDRVADDLMSGRLGVGNVTA